MGAAIAWPPPSGRGDTVVEQADLLLGMTRGQGELVLLWLYPQEIFPGSYPARHLIETANFSHWKATTGLATYIET